MNDKNIMINTEAGQVLPKGTKVLIVGQDDTSRAGLLKAVRDAEAGQVVVVDSYAKPLESVGSFGGWEVQPMDLRNYDLAPARRRFKRTRKPVSKCGLPGCEILSERDYCCAEHCKKHRSMKYIRNVRDAKFTEGVTLTCAPCMNGDSECVVCGKKMLVCWETACIECGDTLCREHAVEKNGLYYCPRCGGKYDEQAD